VAGGWWWWLNADFVWTPVDAQAQVRVCVKDQGRTGADSRLVDDGQTNSVLFRGPFHRWKMVWNPDSIPYIFHISSWKWNGIFHIFIYDVKYAYLLDKCASAFVCVGT
jgi:hypothetical protein